jgi:hypothetical protein
VARVEPIKASVPSRQNYTCPREGQLSATVAEKRSFSLNETDGVFVPIALRMVLVYEGPVREAEESHWDCSHELQLAAAPAEKVQSAGANRAEGAAKP